MKAMLLWITALICAIALLSYGPIPQPQSYHQYADQRTWLNIPHYQNVLTNGFILISGLWGLIFVRKYSGSRFNGSIESILWVLFFLAIILVAIFSTYYHWEPNDKRLAMDRLPMTIATASFFSIIIAERVGKKPAMIIAPIVIILGGMSVIYWILTEMHGQGDLRWYLFMQSYPIIAIPWICGMYPQHRPGTYNLYLAIGWYIMSKITEYYDRPIFSLTDQLVSGHALKHMLTALAIVFLIQYLKARLK